MVDESCLEKIYQFCLDLNLRHLELWSSHFTTVQPSRTEKSSKVVENDPDSFNLPDTLLNQTLDMSRRL